MLGQCLASVRNVTDSNIFNIAESLTKVLRLVTYKKFVLLRVYKNICINTTRSLNIIDPDWQDASGT